MRIEDAETQLRVRFPRKHVEVMLDRTDPVHDWCDFLILESPHKLLRLLDVNESLRGSEHPDPWPDFLVAFASNGCGDYFAYDLRDSPPSVIYIDPDETIDENLASDDQLRFTAFEIW